LYGILVVWVLLKPS